MLLAARLFAMAVRFVLAGGSVPDCRPLVKWTWPRGVVRAVVPGGRGRAHPPLREQEPPRWLRGFARAALLLALSALSLAAVLL